MREIMHKPRQIQKVIKSKPTIEGAGVHLNRAFGNAEVPLFDPFLLLDDFRSETPEYYLKGFPWHPHRGIETITYVIRGSVEHGDSLGNSGVITPGDVQWMTAGSGIIHQEMPKGDSDGALYGFQLWANLPAAQKMTPPRYQGVTGKNVPELTPATGVSMRIICGTVNGVTGPVRDIAIDPEYLDITLKPHSEYTHPTKHDHTVFAYIIDGKCEFCHEEDPFLYDVEGVNYFDMKRDRFIKNHDLVLFSEGDTVTVRTKDLGVRFLLVSGKPLGEPVAWYGPIVMNTQDELRKAFEELDEGTFIQR
jgi:redox-sensitive bicupin YhaK (pirin superfamily)